MRYRSHHFRADLETQIPSSRHYHRPPHTNATRRPTPPSPSSRPVPRKCEPPPAPTSHRSHCCQAHPCTRIPSSTPSRRLPHTNGPRRRPTPPLPSYRLAPRKCPPPPAPTSYWSCHFRADQTPQIPSSRHYHQPPHTNATRRPTPPSPFYRLAPRKCPPPPAPTSCWSCHFRADHTPQIPSSTPCHRPPHTNGPRRSTPPSPFYRPAPRKCPPPPAPFARHSRRPTAPFDRVPKPQRSHHCQRD